MNTLYDKDHPTWRTYWKLVRKFSSVMNLTGWMEYDDMWQLGIRPALCYAQAIEDHKSVIDIGSGQGLPGLVIALVKPSCHVTLLEPSIKKAAFLRMASYNLKVSVVVCAQRAQEARGTYDVITSRAVAALSDLIPWSKHLAHSETVWVVHRQESPLVLTGEKIHYVDYI